MQRKKLGKTVRMYTLYSRSCWNTLPMFLLFDYLEFLHVLKCLLEHLNNSNSVRIPRRNNTYPVRMPNCLGGKFCVDFRQLSRCHLFTCASSNFLLLEYPECTVGIPRLCVMHYYIIQLMRTKFVLLLQAYISLRLRSTSIWTFIHPTTHGNVINFSYTLLTTPGNNNDSNNSHFHLLSQLQLLHLC